MYDSLKLVNISAREKRDCVQDVEEDNRLTMLNRNVQADKNCLEDETFTLRMGDEDNCNAMVEDDADDDSNSPSCCSQYVESIDTHIKEFLRRNQSSLNRARKVVIAAIYFAYFGYCMYYSFGDQNSIVLLTITALVIIKISWSTISPHLPSVSPKTLSCLYSSRGLRMRKILRYVLYLVTSVGFGLYFGLTILQERPENLQSLIGIGVFIIICVVFSTSPGKIHWHPVFWGFIMQFAFASLTLRTHAGYETFRWLGDRLQDFLHFSDKGSAFVIGKDFRSMGLAFWFSGVLVFFNSIIYVLTQKGVIEFIVRKLGMFLHHCLDTGPVESFVASANIFLGFSEVGLLIRPYIRTVTKSELHSIMTCGFASIAGSVMSLFIRSGAPANHLLTAAIISAPSALAITKVLCPETERINYANQRNIKMLESDGAKKPGILQCCSEGALQAVPILVAVVANMIAFVSILALIDAVLDWMGKRAGVEGLSFEFICSFILFPVSYAMGVPFDDCGKVGSLIGVKLFATPIVGYATLGEIVHNREVYEDYTATTNGSWHWSGQDVVLDAVNTTLVRGFMTERSEIIATYALCGFSAFTAIGICMGSLIPMCPQRKDDIIELVLRAFLGGNIASFATGSVAGMMYTGL